MSEGDEYLPEEYWESRLQHDFSLGGVGFIGLGEVFNSWAYKARERVLHKTLAEIQLDPAGLSVLDIGVGTGFYLNVWRVLGVDSVTGIDITGKSVLELSRPYSSYDFVQLDIGDAGVSLGQRFDIITAFDVLHHVVDEKRFENAIANIARHAHPHATVLLMDFFLEQPSRNSYCHQRIRTLEEYERVLGHEGLELVYLQPVFSLLNAPFDISRIGSALLRRLMLGTWWLNSNLALASERMGPPWNSFMRLWGPFIYIADLCATRCIRIGITTKLAVVRPSLQNPRW